jgi:hypothetical protein
MLVVMGQRMVKTPSIRANLEMFVNALGYKYEPTMNAFGKDDVELTNPLPIEQVRSAQQFYGNRDLFMEYFDGESLLKKAMAAVNLRADNFDRVDIGVYAAKLGNQNVATIKMKDGSFEIQAA